MNDSYGKFILKDISKKDKLDVVDTLLKLEKETLPDIIDNIDNPKWRAFVERFKKDCVIVADLLMR